MTKPQCFSRKTIFLEWIIPLGIVFAVVGLGWFLLGPESASTESSLILPIALDSVLAADYGVDEVNYTVKPVDVALVNDVLADKSTSKRGGASVFDAGIFQRPVPTNTAVVILITAESSSPFQPKPTQNVPSVIPTQNPDDPNPTATFKPDESPTVKVPTSESTPHPTNTPTNEPIQPTSTLKPLPTSTSIPPTKVVKPTNTSKPTRTPRPVKPTRTPRPTKTPRIWQTMFVFPTFSSW